MSKLFGTDGIRGVAGEFLTAELALSLGRAATEVLAGPGSGPFVIGRDTRISGHMLESALAAGVLSAGTDVVSLGILPTPAIALLTRQLGASAGAVISASHNPAADNGIKFFGGDGFKLSDEQEAGIEAKVEKGQRAGSEACRGGSGVLTRSQQAAESYVTHALEALEGRRLDGMKIVLDCANGAASWTSPEAFRRAGADVIVLYASPDGHNINEFCGSTYPEVVAAEVVRTGAQLGLAHDGDADRVIAVDENGQVVDGDCSIFALAMELKEQGRLSGNLVVSTVMANLGFRLAMAREGIELVETPVGDRFVLEAMRERGAAMGGEQSGHIIFLEFATTGDGLITALRLAGRMVSTGSRLSELADMVEKFPQVLLNVRVDDPGRFDSSEALQRAVHQAEAELGNAGRILVRPSGTEPLVRVMVEARGDHEATRVAERLAGIVKKELSP